MQKHFIVGMIGILAVLAVGDQVIEKVTNIDNPITLVDNNKDEDVFQDFDQSYRLENVKERKDEKQEQEIKTLAKKTTSLLLGTAGVKEESSESYYNRHKEYLKLRYNPKVPKDSSTITGLDEKSQEYKDDILSGYVVPNLFLKINELGITYTSYGTIRVTNSSPYIIATVTLPNVKMKEQSKIDPMKYDTVTTNLVLYYYYKELNGQYKLCYLYGETTDQVSSYQITLADEETKGSMKIAPSYSSDLSTVYDFEKMNLLTDETLSSVELANRANVVTMTGFYNNQVMVRANGFIISDGIVVTTWSYLESALKKAQGITLQDGNGKVYEMEGIITVNTSRNIAFIKLKSKTNSSVTLGNTPKKEDAIITMSSKTGNGFIVQKGIILSTGSELQTSIPLTEEDQGSPLLDVSGMVVGMNTNQFTNTSISIATSFDSLKEVQIKFNRTNFESIKSVSFKELKEKYYYRPNNKEKVGNNISKKVWNSYRKIGNIDTTIALDLVKSSYQDKIVSLRYRNTVTNYMDTMSFSLPFRAELKKEGYKQTLDGVDKCIYENGKYKIIIMSEFDYLIVVMVKL